MVRKAYVMEDTAQSTYLRRDPKIGKWLHRIRIPVDARHAFTTGIKLSGALAVRFKIGFAGQGLKAQNWPTQRNGRQYPYSLLKIEARVRASVRRIRISSAAVCPMMRQVCQGYERMRA
ncbi:MAG: hypothetical protein AAFW82_04765 [Pseudomonadota bacterium]